MNPQTDQIGEVTLESWKEIAAYIQRDAKTARKWEKEEGLPIHRHTHNSRSSVYAYPSEIDRWRTTRKLVAEPPPPAPIWRRLLTPSFAVTLAMCLVMVGNGVRPQPVEAQQRQTRTLICSGADCDGKMLLPDGKLIRPGVSGLASPDGSRVAYSKRQGPFSRQAVSAEEVFVANVDGTKSRMVFRGGILYAWSPDGKRILLGTLLPEQPTNVTNLLWVDIATGAVQKLPAVHLNLDRARVSPDGKYIAFNASKDDGDTEENVYILAADGSGETIVSPSAAYQEPVEWTPDGKYLVFVQIGAASDLWAARVSGGRVQGMPFNTHVQFDKDVRLLGATRAGAIYYRTVSNTSDIYTAPIDPATGKVTSPVPLPVDRAGANLGPRWSADSTRLAYAWVPRPGNRTKAADIHEMSVYSFASGKNERVMQDAKSVGAFCWNGESLLFNYRETAQPIRPARFALGTKQVSPLFPAGANRFGVRSCSNDLVAGLDGDALKVRSLSNGSEKQIYTGNGGISPALSHDGRTVAFVESKDGTFVLRAVSTAGGTPSDLATVSSPADIQMTFGATWSADDRYVYFARRPDDKSPYELQRVVATGGNAESMALKIDDLRDLDIAPDGKRIAFSIGAVNRPEIWAIRNFLPSGK